MATAGVAGAGAGDAVVVEAEVMTFATLFSGGELAGIGMRSAGLVHKWGVELDDDIAGVARLNGFHVLTADILDIDPATMEPVDALHASPPCTRASNANQSAELNDDGTKEAPLDIELGKKVAEFIDVLQPRWFTLENVYAYRRFRAFGIITAALDRGGYFWDYDNVNAANFAVPQTRRRLFLRAVRGALLPPLPAPEPWVGWYEAIQDLIPTLPDSQFAKWQETRLPAELMESLLVPGGNANSFSDTYIRKADEPSVVVSDVNRTGNIPRAFILSNAKTEYGDGIRDGQESAGTVTGESNGRVRAFVVDQNYGNSNNGGQERILSVKQADEPIFTVGAGTGDKREIRAWLVDGDGNRSRDTTVLDSVEPSMTIQAWHGRRPVNSPRAWLFGDTPEQAARLEESEQAARHKTAERPDWLSQGRVVKLTPRALARFQSVPDSYVLPGKAALACKVIGNGVACLMIEKIYRQLTAGG